MVSGIAAGRPAAVTVPSGPSAAAGSAAAGGPSRKDWLMKVTIEYCRV
jgi:hypothetical protein